MSNQQLTGDKAPMAGTSMTIVPKVIDEPVVIQDGYKRVFDLTLIFLAHVLLFPILTLLWIAIPLAIWLGDRGPIFYTQERIGRHGKRFKVVKFRTMIQNAEVHTGPVWATTDDERVTKVGGLLRKIRLDEMPQVVNILKGEMSLVGPRPERPLLIERFTGEVPGFSERLRVNPGVAGLAQVRGHYSTSPRYKLKYDNLYIETLSPWMDTRLLFLSVWVVLLRIFHRSSS